MASLHTYARDGSGLMLVSKRLEQGGFKWPPIMDGVMRLSAGDARIAVSPVKTALRVEGHGPPLWEGMAR